MPDSEIRAYLGGPFKEIEGWCIPQLWQCIVPLSRAICEAGGAGPVAEIGVYHGKFFVGLLKTMGAPCHNTAIDVFDMQQFNLDQAGAGSRERFLDNLAKSSVSEQAVSLVSVDSLWLTRGDIESLRARTGGFSMFSVDGCHLAQHTVNDLVIASELTKPQGIIFVDDYYNANWPGVQEGVAKYYFAHSPRFVPLLFTCNKLFLCSLSYHQTYLHKVRTFLQMHFPATRVKPVKRFGFDSLTVTPDLKSDCFPAADSAAETQLPSAGRAS